MIMTAALIPLAGMVGGGVDVSRMYILKTRMQHACDAGALAGRKSMGGGTWGYSNYYPRTQAESFFDGNFEWDKTAKTGMFGSSGVSRTFTENAGRVTGTATASIPMTLMRIFGRTSETISVTCDADMRLPNTDVMFVLDTTGSMDCDAKGQNCGSAGANSKMSGLRVAVKCFYEIVARLDTNADCTTGTPSGGTGTQVQIRFGFMPYSTNVNVGYLLPTSYFVDRWEYQTREPSTAYGQWTLLRFYERGQYSACDPAPANTATREYRVLGPTRTYAGKTYGPYYCVIEYRDRTSFQWHYDQLPIDVKLLKNGTLWNRSFQWPIDTNGANRTVTWDGCIEERETVRATSYDPLPAGAKDLDIDMIPTPGDATTQWAPALKEVVYGRSKTPGGYWSAISTDESYTPAEYERLPAFCPTEATRLKQWPTASEFDSYVDSLRPTGNTYHDIGMLWGARFMSPTGMFRADNEFTPQGGDIERHMIFMTDGDAVSAPCDYTAYGVAFFDKRTTTDVGSASGCGGARTSLNNQINARFSGLCEAVKNKNITLWVISFGDGSNTDTETRLSECATPTRFFTARDSAALQQTFKSIADQISQLRLTK